MNLALLAGIGATFLAAGTTKGVAGMGLPTVSIGLLALFMPPASAAALIVLPSLLTNVVQCFGRFMLRIVSLLWPMWLGIVCGALFTPLPSVASGAAGVRAGLGILLLAYAAYGLAKPALSLRLRGPALLATSLAVGYVTGALTAATGVFIFPMVMYLQMLGLEKDEMVQALGLSFTLCTIVLGMSLGWGTSWQALTSTEGVLALATAIVGMCIGAAVRGRIAAGSFRRFLFVVFAILGLAMIVREFV